MAYIHLLNALLMFAIPIGVTYFFAKKWKFGCNLWFIGAIIFILSQIGHIPLNYLVGRILNNTELSNWTPLAKNLFNAIFLGLSAGLWEETARFSMHGIWHY